MPQRPIARQPDTVWTLIATLQSSDDPAAWREFVMAYGTTARKWLRSWGLQATDAEDVWQQVLLDAYRGIRNYRRRPGCRFRSWLKKIAWHAMIRNSKQRGRELAGTGATSVQLAMQMIPDHRATTHRTTSLEADYGPTMDRVRRMVSANEWRAFTLFHFDGKTGAEVAGELGMTLASVHSACSRVRVLLRQMAPADR